MDILQQISNIITNNFGEFCGGAVFLKETDLGSTTKDIKIKKKGRLFQAKFDKQKQNSIEIFPYFTNKKGLRKVSDYILFYLTNNKLYIFICELKSKNTTGSKYQIEAGFVLAQFLINTAIRMQDFPKIEIEYRALLFSHKGIVKGTAKVKKIKYDIYSSSNLKWIHLKDGEDYNLDLLCE